jgi:hypothetical protein
MPRKKKYAQQVAKGCKLCGDPSVGRGIEKHVSQGHGVDYETYKKCFESSGEVVFDELKDTGKLMTTSKKRVVIHVLVRRFEV